MFWRFRGIPARSSICEPLDVRTVNKVSTRQKRSDDYTWQSEFPFRARDLHHLQRNGVVLTPEEQLFIGISDSGHVYLYAKGNRSHGQGCAFAPPLDAVGGGNILKGHPLILEVPTEIVDQLSQFIASPDKKPNFEPLDSSNRKHSCAHSACRQLQLATGIMLAPEPGTDKPAGVLPYWPSNLVKAMIERGFVYADGTPIPNHIVRTTDGNLEDVVRRLQKKEDRIIRQWILIGTLPETVGVPAYVGYLLIKPLFSSAKEEVEEQDDERDEEKESTSAPEDEDEEPVFRQFWPRQGIKKGLQ